ncbi:hypothetical protein JTB14_014856 [Gonioctena quinquepunctata]|nr:hypothetical protein JTB14_014856 [Gonioctena quinquepunctata]
MTGPHATEIALSNVERLKDFFLIVSTNHAIGYSRLPSLGLECTPGLHTTLPSEYPMTPNQNWSISYSQPHIFCTQFPSAPCEIVFHRRARAFGEDATDVVSGVQSLMDSERRTAGVIRKPVSDFPMFVWLATSAG